MLPLLPLLTAVAALAALCAGDQWEYTGPNGPESWGGACTAGLRQSPVDLSEEGATRVSHEPLALVSYAADSPATALNNGHSVEVRLESPCPRAIAAGGLGDVYVVDHLHFHWDAEHTFSGKRWPLEMHIVHRKERYASVQQALKDKTGVAVLAVLFHVGEYSSSAMGAIEDTVRKVAISAGATYKLPNSINLRDLLPKDTYSYFRYHGSLTTPGCNESVVWTVFRDRLTVTKQQLDAFRRVRGINLNSLDFNYRPIQPLNGREVQVNVAQSSSSSANILHHQYAFCTLTSVFITLAFQLFQK